MLQVLAIGLVPWVLGRTFANVLVAGDLQRYDLIASVAATVVNIGLNLLLIPRYGAVGAAIAHSCSISLFCVMEMWYVRRLGVGFGILRSLKLPTGVALLALLILLLARIHMAVALLEAGLVAGAGLFYMKKHDYRKTFAVSLNIIRSIIRA